MPGDDGKCIWPLQCHEFHMTEAGIEKLRPEVGPYSVTTQQIGEALIPW
jgi:hypothetical protein